MAGVCNNTHWRSWTNWNRQHHERSTNRESQWIRVSEKGRVKSRLSTRWCNHWFGPVVVEFKFIHHHHHQLIGALTSLIHFGKGRRRSGIWWGAADFWSWESSAYEWLRTVWQWKEKLCKERRVQVQGLILVHKHTCTQIITCFCSMNILVRVYSFSNWEDTSGGVYVPFSYSYMPGESYRRQISSLLCLCDFGR